MNFFNINVRKSVLYNTYRKVKQFIRVYYVWDYRGAYYMLIDWWIK